MKTKEKQDYLIAIQSELKAPKNQFNSFGKYYFRSAEDILEATKPFLLEHGVTIIVNEELIGEGLDEFRSIKTTATISDGLEAINATAIVGVDLNQKGMQMPQRFGAASSYGKKYALGNLFLIDDTQDSDATNDHGASSTNVKQWISKDSNSYDKAVEYIKSGGKVDSIKKKYAMTKDMETHLQSL